MRHMSEFWLYHFVYTSSFSTPRVLFVGVEGQLWHGFPALLGFLLSPMSWELHWHLSPFLGSFPIWIWWCCAWPCILLVPVPADLTSQLNLRLALFTMDLSGSHWALGWPQLLSPDLLLFLQQRGTAKVAIKDSVPASVFLWFSPLLLFLDSRCFRQSVLQSIFNTSLEVGIDSTVYEINRSCFIYEIDQLLFMKRLNLLEKLALSIKSLEWFQIHHLCKFKLITRMPNRWDHTSI